MKTIFDDEMVRFQCSHLLIASYYFCCLQKKAQAANRPPSLWRVYWRTYWPMIVLGGLFKVMADQMMYVPPVLLDFMVQYFIRETYEADNKTDVTSVNETVCSITYQYISMAISFF